MNLIEQLGGYEKAKTIVDKAPCKTYTYHNHPYQKGYIRCWGGDGKEYFMVSDIEQALLQHRREHGIFEVGDKVVFSDYFMHGDIMTVSKIDDCEMWMDDGAKWTHNFNDMIEHATDEEVEANKLGAV